MPKSKRDKQVTLTKTQKKPSSKLQLAESIQESVDSYSRIFVIEIHNMRNVYFKKIRQEIQGVLYFGKNKVIQKVLGMDESSELVPGIHQVCEHMVGNDRALLFTNWTREQVDQVLQQHEYLDFAKGGQKATHRVVLPAGPLVVDDHPLPGTMSPFLLKLGLPCEIQKGQIVLRSEFVVCEPDQILTPERANLLKQIQVQMAAFRVQVVFGFEK
jgi:mRNA turnover protein 4